MNPDYTAEIRNFRQRKDEHFASGRGPIRDVSAFGGLHYYPPDPAWRFELPLLLPSPDQHGEFVLTTTTGEPRHMALLGRIELPSGERLSVFGPLGEEQPARGFIPFRDATSGQATYGAGRYIDAPISYAESQHTVPQMTVTADFNLAYHPYCAYSDGWTCPLPPPENVLRVAVLAGEKLAQT